MDSTWYRSRRKSLVRRRRNPRRFIKQPALLKTIENLSLLGKGTILDISEGGARLQAERPAEIPDSFILVLSAQAQTFRLCQVRWRSEDELGIEFMRG
jgi:hypothetical protein